MTLAPEQVETTMKRLESLRAKLMLKARPSDDGSLVPLLTAAAEVCAIDTCLRLLRKELREVAS